MQKRDLPTITMQDLIGLAHRTLQVADEVAAAQAALRKAEKRLELHAQNLLPNAMRELDITEFKLSDGRKIQLSPKVSASVTPDRMEQARAWLTEHNLNGIIKHQLILEFGKGEDDVAERVKRAVLELLEDVDLDHSYLTDKESIHNQTLCAMIREQMRNSVDIPEEPFALHITDAVKVVVPK